MAWASNIAELLWHSAWAVIPLVLLVAAICRWMPCRPVTRHALWVVVLAAFLAPLIVVFVPLPELLPAADFQQKQNGDVGSTPSEPLAELPIVQEPFQPERFRAKYSTRRPARRRPLQHQTTSEPVASSTNEPRTVDTALSPARSRAGGYSRVGRENAAISSNVLQSTTARIETHLSSAEPTSPQVATPAPRLSKDKVEPSSMWRIWGTALADVRDALTRLPTLPACFWLLGIAALVVTYVCGSVRFWWRLRRAERAPESMERMVAAIARRFDLRRVPEVVMLDASISPMVWCGRRARLVLPTELWSQLDRVGRRAIICHELAHLRRRDHWVRWLELLISAVFWWHPLVWWVRRRVHEEADLCCDAWVTWLMPRRRRAYAEALLAAREYVGTGGRPAPAVAMSVTTSGAKRFTRRITMVMTQSTRPGISLAGIGLACTLALAGWIATPAWSCPPKDKCDSSRKTIVAKSGDAVECDKKHSQRKTVVKKLHTKGGHTDALGTFYALAMGDDTGKSPHLLVQSLDQTDDDLEQRLARLEKAVERLNKLLGGRAIDVHMPTPPAPPTWHTPRGVAVKVGENDLPVAIALGQSWRVDDEGEIVVRAYKLPAGKLKALTALMVRQDVPILVRPQGDCIEVHATPAHHKIFKVFVDMIHPTGKCKDRKVKVIGSATGMSALVDVYPQVSKFHESRAKGKAALKEASASQLLKSIDVYEDALKKLGDCKIIIPEMDIDVIEMKTELLEELNEQMEEQAEQLRNEAEQLQEQAEELREHADAFEDEKPREARELFRAVRELHRQAKKLHKLAEQLDKKSRRADSEVPDL